jgi:hypothetical protein
MAISPTQASNLIKTASDLNSKTSDVKKAAKDFAQKQQSDQLLKNSKDPNYTGYNQDLKSFRDKKKKETEEARAKLKAERDAAKIEAETRKNNLNQTQETIENNTPSDQKPKGPSKLNPVITAQAKKLSTLIIPNLITLATNYISENIDLCPPPDVTKNALENFNNIVKDLNNTAEGINKIAGVSQIIATGANTIQQISTALKTTIPVVSAAAKLTPVIPGAVVSALDDLDYFNNILLYANDGTPKLPPIIAGVNGLAVSISVFSLGCRNAASIITNISLKLQQCLPPADHKDIEQLSDITKQYTEYGINTYDNYDLSSYQGFNIRIEEVPFTPTVTRRRAVGYSPSGVPMIQTELSFTSNAQTLVTELKLIIDRDNLKAY